jgi:hypothetical protein
MRTKKQESITVRRTRFLYDDDGTAIGKVDSADRILTLEGKESFPHVMTKLGPAVNRAHQARVAAFDRLSAFGA